MMRTCSVCRQQFTPTRIKDGRYSRATTCSHECRHANNDTAKATAAAAQTNTGRGYHYLPGSPNSIALHYGRHVMAGYHLRPCKQCGGLFPRSHGRHYCSEDCRAEYARQEIWRRNTKGKVLTCPECGTQHSPLRGSLQDRYGAQSFCSDKCRRKRNRSGDRAAQRRRRAKRIRHGYVEHVGPCTVFTRDDWTCQRCGAHTPPDLVGSVDDDTAPTVDHIVALVNGGEHSYRNVQLLCRRCNYTKGIVDYPQPE